MRGEEKVIRDSGKIDFLLKGVVQVSLPFSLPHINVDVMLVYRAAMWAREGKCQAVLGDARPDVFEPQNEH